jgi:NADH-quinone oxidoreductase subunit E
MVSEDLRKRLKKIVENAHDPREALVDVIMEYQRRTHWLDEAHIEEIAEITGISPLQVDELTTFYNLMFRKPVGKRVILICDSISCSMMGSDTLIQYLCNTLNIDLGGTTQDGMFTLLPICCLGNCGEAPAMLIGEKLYGNLIPEKIEEILKEERKKADHEKDS